MATITLTKENFEVEAVHSEVPVLIDFWAPWCPPCRAISPLLEQLSEELPDIKVVTVNVDEQMELASAFGVFSIPMIVVMLGGEVQTSRVGLMSKEEISSMF